MIKILKHIYHKTIFGKLLISIYHDYWKRLPPEKMRQKIIYKKKLGKKLDLKNPKTFNEKLQWLKFNNRDSIHTICADKYKVRSYVADKIGEKYLVPLLFETKNVNTLLPENLPDVPFVVKTNHQSGGVFLIEKKNEIDWTLLRTNLEKRLKTNYYNRSREWQYKNIEPRIVVEKMLLDQNGNVPSDYKLHCFNGKVGFIQVDLNRASEHRRNIYDPEWNLLDCKYNYDIGNNVEKPKVLEKMKQLAEVLAKDFIFSRIDFYVVENNIFFGEITFHPESGIGKFTPNSWDETFGQMLDLKLGK